MTRLPPAAAKGLTRTAFVEVRPLNQRYLIVDASSATSVVAHHQLI
jgi:hypothetical protein